MAILKRNEGNRRSAVKSMIFRFFRSVNFESVDCEVFILILAFRFAFLTINRYASVFDFLDN